MTTTREAWTDPAGRTVVYDVRPDQTVIVAVEVLRGMLDDLGYERVDGTTCEVCNGTGLGTDR